MCGGVHAVCVCVCGVGCARMWCVCVCVEVYVCEGVHAVCVCVVCTVNFPWLRILCFVSVVIHRFPAFPEPRGYSVLKLMKLKLA